MSTFNIIMIVFTVHQLRVSSVNIWLIIMGLVTTNPLQVSYVNVWLNMFMLFI